ncbi:MAG: Mur ligase family protein [Campylobacterota bacterium]|nr:Mur ligase family protein [Campylobacterota bacterium]
MIDTLDTFLESKPLYYKEIDHDRVHIAYRQLKPHIKQPRTIHIVGTNGKGSTGRMIAHLAFKSGLRVGHYSSPHILKFNERIWINGVDCSDEVLQSAHQKLFIILGQKMSESLSYFEYTTLLAFIVFEPCDLMVLEAGLGGEFDATNVCDKELSIITPIGLDHQAFLGDTIEEIAATKIRSIQNNALVAPQIFNEVYNIAKKIANEKGTKIHFSKDTSHLYIKNVGGVVLAKGWADYLIDNAIVAIQALEILAIPYALVDLWELELFGRFYALTDNIRIDVGHNALAAQAIVKELDAKVVLIYNVLEDKAYEEVLRILKPKVKSVEILPIYSGRAATVEAIEKALEKVGLAYSHFSNQIDDDEKYLVFGSFYVVEEFLKRFYVPK